MHLLQHMNQLEVFTDLTWHLNEGRRRGGSPLKQRGLHVRQRRRGKREAQRDARRWPLGAGRAALQGRLHIANMKVELILRQILRAEFEYCLLVPKTSSWARGMGQWISEGCVGK